MDQFLSAQQQREFKGVFKLFDKTNKGYITEDDLKAGMIALRLHPKEGEVKQLMQEANVTGSGKVDFSEFIGVLTRKLGRMDGEAEILKAFNTFDRNDKGYIPVEDLRRPLTTLGDKLSDKEMRAVISEGADEDGLFHYEAFTKKMVGKTVTF